MPKLKLLSGGEIVAILQSFGFVVAGQKGSHVKLKRVLGDSIETLTIPNHKELDRGTIKAIYNQAARFVDAEKLKEQFYSK